MAMVGIPVQYRLRVKQRLAVVRYAEAVGIKPAGRHFGLHYRTVRIWRNRWRREGDAGLIPRYPARRCRRRVDDRTLALIREARVEQRLGAGLTRIWLARVHQIQLSSRTIQRTFRDLGLPYLTKTPKRRPRQMKLFEKDEPGESVQADVKVIIRDRQRWFQYTAIDDCTRVRVLRLYRQLNQRSSLRFLEELRDALPFPIRKIQVDNGTEWSLAFALRCRELGIRVRYIKPRRPQQNGKVERSHRIDEQEFWTRYLGTDFTEATAALAAWAHRYNHDRFSMALHGRTPMEKLAAILARRAPPLEPGGVDLGIH
jgi:transposase InsO family protein